MTAAEKEQFKASLKHPDVEEPIDLWFYRPWGFRLALLGQRMHWTPNQITVASIFLGVGCGLLCYPTEWRLNLLGIVLLVLADICDSADGQLARLTRQYSPMGRILDGAAGDVWFITIYLAIFFRLFPEWGWWGFALGLAAGLSHRQQAALADYYRQIHLLMAKVSSGSAQTISEFTTYRQEKQKLDGLSLRQRPVETIFQWFYVGYIRFQEGRTPQWQAFRARYAADALTSKMAEAFRQQSRPLMPIANAQTFNCRAITLFVSLMLGMPWLYWVVEITVFNGLYFYMNRQHEKICSGLIMMTDKQETPDKE